MKTFRSILFWMHLAAGAFAGVVVLIMSVTGVALTYEKQMLEWADRRAWTAPSPADARPLPPETLLAQVSAAQPGTAPLGLTLRADRRAPATRHSRRQQDPARRSLYRRDYRRAADRPAHVFPLDDLVASLPCARTARAAPPARRITGAANLAFLFIVLSGLYLWLPRRLDVDPVQERAVVPRRSGAEGP